MSDNNSEQDDAESQYEQADGEEYVYTGPRPHTRSVDEGEDENIEPGDTFVPTDAELVAFGDRLVPASDYESDADNAEPRPQSPAQADPEADDSRDVVTAEDTGESHVLENYSEDDIRDMTYTELRQIASLVDGVAGNDSRADIEEGLIARLEGSGIAEEEDADPEEQADAPNTAEDADYNSPDEDAEEESDSTTDEGVTTEDEGE